MRRERNLSDFWRITRSDDRVRELTSVLQGADSMIGVMGSGVRTVWSTNGQSATYWMRTQSGKNFECQVFLDYSPLAQLKSPYSGQAVDEVIGYAAHEGGHVLWTDPNAKDQVTNILNKRKLPNLEPTVKEVLRTANILEDAYIDYHVGEEWPVLGEYIRWSRKKVGERRPIGLDEIASQKNPCRNHVMNLWIACTLYDAPIPDKLSAKVRVALDFLISKSVEAIKEENNYVRLVMAVDCWEALQKFPDKDEALPRKPEPQKPEPEPQKSREDSGEGQPSEDETDGSQGEPGEGQGGGEEDNESGDKPDDESGEGEADKQDDKLDDESGDSQLDKPDDKPGDEPGEGQGDETEGQPEGEAAGGHGEGDEGQGEGNESGDIEGDTTGEPEEGQPTEASPQGGDEQGSPGNLDEFDLRDLVEMPEELLEAVMDAISHELEDLSRSVAEVINRPLADVNAQTKKADYDAPAADKVRSEIQKEIAEMRRVFDKEKTVQSRCIKGMPSGKIDSRSLAKVGTGNFKVFKRRQVLGRPDLAVGLLLDVSGSMSGQMGVVWMTAGVFAESLIRKPGINFMALTYTGSSTGNCQTTRICDRQMARLHLGNVEQGGGTPTGEAIASMKVLMDRMTERKKVIIHFTDGYPDNKYSVIQAVKSARDAGYKVWSIAPKGHEQMLQEQYGDGNWETIASISELPQKVFHLVKTLA